MTQQCRKGYTKSYTGTVTFDSYFKDHHGIVMFILSFAITILNNWVIF